ncbi:TetR/AcrR family transcriptional regulator [Levilactobacillus acidifarinae]|uniref:HTH tetR-type domain-containing protein n=3 Tax=Levilactobacillus acidifarinae TaxID=267364 RepID=A0A0R1LH25_9LACO|nr:hypothetical protein FD25_GL002209 [Levilactobacillus acidifarinae DSM 19394]
MMKIDQQAILKAATEILNTKGIAALSMRAIAANLDVKAASLYFHIKNKNDLFEQISEGISQRVFEKLNRVDEPDLQRLMDVFRAELKRIQDSPQIFSNTAPFTPYRTRLIQFSLDHLQQLGVPQQFTATAGNLLNNYVLSFVSDEQYFSRVDSSTFDESQFKSPINMADPDDSFQYGLNLIFAGIRVQSKNG